MPAARPSGREDGELREITCERGLLNRADGSARWSQEDTSVIAAVWGPRAAKTRKQEDAQRATIEVVFKPKSGIAGSLEAEYEKVMRNTLEAVVMRASHPRCVIQVVIQVVSDDGSVLCSALNAACAALVDAGVQMDGQLAAVSLAVGEGGSIVIDPDQAEEKGAQAAVTLAFPSRRGLEGQPAAEPGVLASYTRGGMRAEDFLSCVELGRAGSERVTGFSRLSLQRYQRGSEMATQ